MFVRVRTAETHGSTRFKSKDVVPVTPPICPVIMKLYVPGGKATLFIGLNSKFPFVMSKDPSEHRSVLKPVFVHEYVANDSHPGGLLTNVGLRTKTVG